ncbi:hypothetical protein ACTPOE_16795 [Castellaniella sp. WN]
MAGEWLKFEVSTLDKPEVLAITVAMGWDDPDLTVGKLLRVWRWFDQQTIDGNAPGVTTALLDRLIGVTGLCAAMEAVGWLDVYDGGLMLPNFDRHNGKTAKNRALTAKRVANHKTNAIGNDGGNAGIVSDALPREEKKRKDKTPPNPQGGESPPKPKREPRIQLKTFIDQCVQAGEKPISGYQPLLDYVESTGLPMEFVQIAWDVFKREFLPPGQHAHRLQARWRQHFLNYVEKGYYRLWYAKQTDDGPVYELSTQGIQAQASLREIA